MPANDYPLLTFEAPLSLDEFTKLERLDPAALREELEERLSLYHGYRRLPTDLQDLYLEMDEDSYQAICFSTRQLDRIGRRRSTPSRG